MKTASMPPSLSTASPRWSRRRRRPAPTPPMRSPCAAARAAFRCGSARSRRPNPSESDDISLRVFVGKRVASVSATAASDAAMLAERAVAMARVSPEDPYQGLADPARLAKIDPRPRPVRRYRDSGRAAEGGRARRRRGRAFGQGRHQFGRQRRQRRARRAGARHLARLPRPVSRLALLALGKRDRRRGHRDGARLRLFLAPAFRRSRRARRDRPQGRRARRAPPQCAQGRDRPGDGRSTIRAWRAASPAISPARSTAPRSPARPASCAT